MNKIDKYLARLTNQKREKKQIANTNNDMGLCVCVCVCVCKHKIILKFTSHSKYSCLGNARGRGAWRATVHGVSKTQI